MRALKDLIFSHPNLTAWIVLALGMNAILLFEARDVGLATSQWFWLVVITTLVAGACIWIVSWGDKDDVVADLPAADVAAIDETADLEA